MARRRRRRMWKRVSPERGWLIGQEVLVLEPDSGALTDNFGQSAILQIASFDQIDPDEGTLITHDKSDWYVVRVIVDAYFYYYRAILGARFALQYEAVLATFDDAEGDNIVSTSLAIGGSPISVSNYERYARIVGSSTGICMGNQDLVDYMNTTPTRIRGGTVLDRTVQTAPMFHGNGVSRWDVKTRFGLRENQSFGLIFGGSSSAIVGELGLTAGDPGPDVSQLVCSAQWRLLLQKRR